MCFVDTIQIQWHLSNFLRTIHSTIPMSDSVKPDEKPVVLEGANVAEEIPTTSEAGPATVTDEVTAAELDHTIDEATSEEKKEEKAEPKEITHGTLSKAHGGLLA